MEKVDLTEFYKETDTPETRAYERELELEYITARKKLEQELSNNDQSQRTGTPE